MPPHPAVVPGSSASHASACSTRGKLHSADPTGNKEKCVTSFGSRGKSSIHNFCLSPTAEPQAQQHSQANGSSQASLWNVWSWGKRQSCPQELPWRARAEHQHTEVSCCPGSSPQLQHHHSGLWPLSWAPGTFLSPGEVGNTEERPQGCSSTRW